MCERASIAGATHPACRTKYSLDKLISFFRFDGPIKSIIHRLKYKPWIADLASITINIVMSNNRETYREQFKGFTVIPVPLHKNRQRSRGFNQAGLIGKEIAKQLGLEFKDGILKRATNTRPQIELKGKERRENIKNAFATTNNHELQTMNSVLLIDDVWTTGSTLRVCANVLKRAGAKKVWAMTLAR